MGRCGGRGSVRKRAREGERAEGSAWRRRESSLALCATGEGGECCFCVSVCCLWVYGAHTCELNTYACVLHGLTRLPHRSSSVCSLDAHEKRAL